MSKLACIIVDDEPLAIEVIESYVQQFDSLELKRSFQNPIKAFEYIRNNKIDLIFMDIQMPKLTGLDILRSLHSKPQVIITTAYRDYALEGFELEVTDYLLKPISFERFVKAISKIRGHQFDPKEGMSRDYVFLKVDKKMVKVFLENIYYIESQRDYIKIVEKDREILTHMGITEAENVFPEEQFFRVHRSFIVSKNKIDSFGASEIELGNHQIPIGRNYRSEVLKILNNLASIS